MWFQPVESWLDGFRSEARQYDGNKTLAPLMMLRKQKKGTKDESRDRI